MTNRILINEALDATVEDIFKAKETLDADGDIWLAAAKLITAAGLLKYATHELLTLSSNALSKTIEEYESPDP